MTALACALGDLFKRVKVAEDLLVHLGRAVDRPVHFCYEGASVGAVKTVLGYSL